MNLPASVQFFRPASWDRGPVAPCPIEIYAQYKGKPRLVVGAAGSKAVFSDGKPRKSGESTEFFLKRVQAYPQGRVEISQPGLSSIRERTESLDGGVRLDERNLGAEYTAKLVSDTDYPDCYLALMLVVHRGNPATGMITPGVRLEFLKLGELEAGREKPITISLGRNVAHGLSRGFGETILLVFSQGREIRTNLAGKSVRLFRSLEVQEHEQKVADHIARNRVGELSPVLRVCVMPPFPSNIDRAELPNVSVLLHIQPTGLVGQVELPQTLPDDVAKSITLACQSWLYLPKLKDGRPINSEVRVTLNLREPLTNDPNMPFPVNRK